MIKLTKKKHENDDDEMTKRKKFDENVELIFFCQTCCYEQINDINLILIFDKIIDMKFVNDL